MTDEVVLVHGAWGDATIWKDVTTVLADRGHHTIAVELGLTSLADDVARTRRAIAGTDGRVTLVGHSYGGSVISGVLDDPRVAALVFVAAYVPDTGESVAALSEQGAVMPGRAAIQFGADGWTHLDPTLFGDALGADLPTATTRALAVAQRPTRAGCVTDRADRGAWHGLPCSYVLSAADRILDPDLQRWFASRCGARTVELDTSHLSPLTRPDDVATAIGEATAAVSTRPTRRRGSSDPP